MNKVKSLADLKQMRDRLHSELNLRERSNNPDAMVQIKVSMGTCGIAAGAKDVFNYLVEALDREKIDAVITQTGCMGYCNAEPTIEVKLPGQEAIVYGDVDAARADDIIHKYIENQELVEGIIPSRHISANL